MLDTGLYLTAICMACHVLPVQVFKVRSAIIWNEYILHKTNYLNVTSM